MTDTTFSNDFEVTLNRDREWEHTHNGVIDMHHHGALAVKIYTHRKDSSRTQLRMAGFEPVELKRKA